MEDPQPLPPNDSNEPDPESEAEQQRIAEAAMEEFLREQEEAEHIPETDNAPAVEPQDEGDDAAPLEFGLVLEDSPSPKRFHLSYVSTSFLVAFCMIYYAARSQQQFYLALVYLSGSKVAYIVLGNALIAFAISVFQFFTQVLLNGLRLAEAEGLGEFCRWTLMETCLAWTMFRPQLSIQTAILAVVLVLAKCMHWVVEMRAGQVRMTEEAVVAHPTTQWPALRWAHIRLLIAIFGLQVFDLLALVHCGQLMLQEGPYIYLLFTFESSVLLTSSTSTHMLWHLHVLDGTFHYFHETTEPGTFMHRWIHPWKDYKATLTFAVELQAQAVKFLFYVGFFAVYMSYHGIPVSLFRELFLSFQSLKQRLLAFTKYRQLMASMDKFPNPTEEELTEEPTCIICRDEMTVDSTKKLPGCGHLFHKSCLRDWLVQQQYCPTCRADISSMRARRELDRQETPEPAEDTPPATDDANEDNAGETAKEENASEAAKSEPATAPQEPPKLKEPPPPTAPLVETAPRTTNYAPPNYESPMEDSKPAAKRRGKHVKFESRPAHAGMGGMSHQYDEARTHFPAFPAFYRVVQDQGAAVYNNGEAVSIVIREVPFGIVVLGQEMTWRNCEGENRLMVRIPDGWVRDDDVDRVVAVPLS